MMLTEELAEDRSAQVRLKSTVGTADYFRQSGHWLKMAFWAITPGKHATGLDQTEWQGTEVGVIMKGPVGRQLQPAPTLVLDSEARGEAWVQGLRTVL